MAADPELREFLARIYELLLQHEKLLFEDHLKILALEMALNANSSFAELYREKTTQIQLPEVKQMHEAAIRSIAELIRQLRGKTHGLN
jgi:hypothetical protein